jgi:hypothetical protein
VVGVGQREVLARYGNWFRGDDDEFAHCLVLRGGECVLLFQGLRPVTLQIKRVDEQKHKRLVELLEAGIPAEWSVASYQGYNFITDAEGPDKNEIAVFGVPIDSQTLAGYYAAPPESEIGRLVVHPLSSLVYASSVLPV